MSKKYDDGSWHTGDGHTEAQAAAHIGLYFKWCVVTDLVSEEFTDDDDWASDLERIKSGTLSATEFLWENTSGKFSDADLTDSGNRFTAWFYKSEYPKVLLSVANADRYQFTEEQVDFARLKAQLDHAYLQWQTSPPRKPWWKRLWGA